MMSIDQSEYALWTNVAGMLIFLHDKPEIVYPESVSYIVTPGTSTTFVIAGVRLKQTSFYSQLVSPIINPTPFSIQRKSPEFLN